MSELKSLKTEQLVKFSGEVWRVIGKGTVREDGHVYLHLSNTVRGRQQRNGFCPIQAADYFGPHEIEIL